MIKTANPNRRIVNVLGTWMVQIKDSEGNWYGVRTLTPLDAKREGVDRV